MCIKTDTCRGKGLRSILWAVLHQYIMSLRISQTLIHLAADLMTEPSVMVLHCQLFSQAVGQPLCVPHLLHTPPHPSNLPNFLFIKTSNCHKPCGNNRWAQTLPSYGTRRWNLTSWLFVTCTSLALPFHYTTPTKLSSET